MSKDGIMPEVAPPVELRPLSPLLLLTLNIRPLGDLDEWLELLWSAQTMEEIIGLLHVGFDMNVTPSCWEYPVRSNHVDRLRCYFGLADGYNSKYGGLWIPQDSPGGRNLEYFYRRDQSGNQIFIRPSEIRQLIAQKAMKELSLHFFKKQLPEEGKKPKEKWAEWIVKEGLLVDLQHFFRIEEKYGRRRMTNFTLDHNGEERILISFLINLAQFLWEWEAESAPSYWTEEEQLGHQQANDKLQTAIDQAKPWMIEVLAELGKLGVLEKYLLDLEEASLEKLREIALRAELNDHRHPVNEDRLVRDVDEAVYAGSSAAMLLVKHAIKARVDQKLKQVRQAERKIRRAQEELQQLEPGQ